MTRLVEGYQPKRNVKERWHQSQRYISEAKPGAAATICVRGRFQKARPYKDAPYRNVDPQTDHNPG